MTNHVDMYLPTDTSLSGRIAVVPASLPQVGDLIEVVPVTGKGKAKTYRVTRRRWRYYGSNDAPDCYVEWEPVSSAAPTRKPPYS